MDGAKKFKEAADRYLSEMSEVISSSTVIKKTKMDGDVVITEIVLDADREKEMSELIIRGLQISKLMGVETKAPKGKEKDAVSMTDKWANEKNADN